MPDTQRTSREQAEGYATAWGTRPDGIVQLAMDYLAALDVLAELYSAMNAADDFSNDMVHYPRLFNAHAAAAAFLASTEGEQP